MSRPVAAGSWGGRVNEPIDIVLGHLDEVLIATVDVEFLAPDGTTLELPAFQDAAGSVRVRFAPPSAGRHAFAVRSSDPRLAGVEGAVTAVPYDAGNALYRHGRLRVAPGRRTLEHADGTPFLWVGDTWWMGLGTRLRWPDEFHHLLADRARKGFSLIQVVAGPLPEFSALREGVWHPAQANEAGWPWHPDWVGLNAAYYDHVDRRIAAIVDAGLVPCIVAMWGSYYTLMGEQRVRQHWRNLVARYAAYPVVLCVAGEVNLPPLEERTAEERAAARVTQVEGWTAMTHEVRAMDPYRNPVTAHPAHPGIREVLPDPSALDIDMLQTSHWSYAVPATTLSAGVEDVLGLERPIRFGFDGTLALTREALAAEPPMPVVNGEPSYEGIMGGNWQEVQRFHFWTSMLSGLAGFTYGAQGIWQMNTARDPYRSRTSWGAGFWEDAMHYPGSHQIGLGRRLLEELGWPGLRPVEADAAVLGDRVASFLARGEDRLVAYLPPLLFADRHLGMRGRALPVSDLAGGSARFLDPRTGAALAIGEVLSDGDGRWTPPEAPSLEDWLLVVDRADRGA